MRISLLQQNIMWNSPRENMLLAEDSIMKSAGSDVYVLPEMWSTGYAPDPSDIAESDDSESLEWMKIMASRTNAAIVGSIIVRESADSSFRNRMYFVKPDGEYQFYDKHHLFTFGGEHQHFKAGNERVVVEWRGVRFLILVCYDIRFPKWSRNEGDYDAIIYSASWPIPRIEAWRVLLRARAIENQSYVIGVNRVGADPYCEYNGASAFVTPYGEATECPKGDVSQLIGEIDMESLNKFRAKFPVLKDRD